jgi:hypothetical protein
MGMIAPPFIYPDLLNAGATLKDRGKYLRSGAFTWLPSGNNGFTGVVVGYAPCATTQDNLEIQQVAGSIGIDGGVAMPCQGGGLAINRWSAGSVQVNGGIAWGVAFPSTANSIVSNFQVTAALDRMHKDGTWSRFDHLVDYGATGDGFRLGAAFGYINQAGPGILLDTNLKIRAGSGWGATSTMCASMEVHIDGTYRFSHRLGHTVYAASTTEKTMNGTSGSYGFIPFASNLTINLRRGSDHSQRIEASSLYVLGA